MTKFKRGTLLISFYIYYTCSALILNNPCANCSGGGATPRGDTPAGWNPGVGVWEGVDGWKLPPVEDCGAGIEEDAVAAAAAAVVVVDIVDPTLLVEFVRERERRLLLPLLLLPPKTPATTSI